MSAAPRSRILYVHHRSELGGAPTSLSYVIRALDRERFEPHVYCPPGQAAELFRDSGAIVHEGPVAGFTHIWASTYRGRRWLLFVRELGRLPGHLFRFRQVLGRHEFHLVHLNDSPLLPAALVARWRRLPIVWHIRSALPVGGLDLRSRLMRRFVLRLADVTIAINEDIAEVWRMPAQVIPNSVQIDRFYPGDPRAACESLGISAVLPLVTYVGFLYPSKGFREFIRAAALLREQGVEASYLIVGSGVRGDEFFRTLAGRLLQRLDLARNYNAEAHRLASSLGLDDVVRWVPFTREIEEIYRASEIVIAPSQGPEIGRPMLEGAASGVTVIGTGTRTGGGILKPGETTILADGFDAPSLADSVRRLLDEPERRRRIGAAAREHAVTFFDPVRNARRIEQIYDRLLTRERVRVLYVHHRPQLGGAPRSLAELIRSLDRSRYEPHVFVPDGPAADLFVDSGAIVHVGPTSVFAHAWDNPYSGLRWLVLGREALFLVPHLRALRALMARYDFSVVHLNDSPLLAAAWMARRHRARVVWHLRSALAGGGDDRRSRVIGRLIDRWGDAAIAIDEDVARNFPVRLPVTIVHNSVPRPERSLDTAVAKRNQGLPADRLAIGYAGFVRSEKGWPELVRAMRMLVDEGLPAQLVIVGGGVRPPAYFKTVRGRILELAHVLTDEESAIKSLVAELDLESHVSFLPFQLRLQEVYDVLDIVTFPNPGIGLGRPVLEAAAYGKPVVASGSHSGAGLLTPEVTGLLLEDPHPRAIADALRRLIVDPELRRRLGEAAALHARLSFDPAANARRVEKVYESLLGPLVDLRTGVPDEAAAPEPASSRA